MGFKSREKKRRASAAVAGAVAQQRANYKDRHYLTIVTRSCCCNACGCSLRAVQAVRLPIRAARDPVQAARDPVQDMCGPAQDSIPAVAPVGEGKPPRQTGQARAGAKEAA